MRRSGSRAAVAHGAAIDGASARQAMRAACTYCCAATLRQRRHPPVPPLAPSDSEREGGGGEGGGESGVADWGGWWHVAESCTASEECSPAWHDDEQPTEADESNRLETPEEEDSTRHADECGDAAARDDLDRVDYDSPLARARVHHAQDDELECEAVEQHEDRLRTRVPGRAAVNDRCHEGVRKLEVEPDGLPRAVHVAVPS
eukprot:3288856-Prymnesium_polylepis.2